MELDERGRLTAERFRELRERTPGDLDAEAARALLRELKAVGGDLRSLRLVAHRCDQRPRALGGARRPDARGGTRPREHGPALTTILGVRLYSSFSRRPEEVPPPPGPIGMYFCGPTVYQRIHVGNARPFVISMWLRNWLRLRGYDVTLVENITDINDKIYDAAPGASAQLAEQASRWYVEDTDRLGLGRPDFEPKASETVAEILALIEELIARGLAYEAGGDVYFRVARFEDYGRLSGQRPDEVQEQEPNPLKEDPRDFALWKATKPGEDTRWESPWGLGRPGWHIECSAMAEKYLGPSFEIHGGGLDLVFPHHENELAQSRGAEREFARIWMHNGMLRLTGEKMSKSLGNIATLQEVLDEWGRETLLLFFMTAHWRKPIDFSQETMAAARAQVDGFRNVLVEPATSLWTRQQWAGWWPPSTTTSTRRRRWRCCTTGGAGASAAGCCAACRSSASSLWRSGRRRPRRFGCCSDVATRRETGATSPRPTGCATRFSPTAGSRATPLTARRSCPANDSASRARLRPPPGARGAPRGPPRDSRASSAASELLPRNRGSERPPACG